MASSYVTKIAGLHTSPNETGSVPEGALIQADNCVIRNKDVIEPRRGHEQLTYAPGSTPKQLFQYNGTVLAHSGTALSRDTGSAFTAYSGSYTEPDSTLLRMKGAEAQQSFYFTTTTGIKCLDAVANTPAAAGVPAALDPYLDWTSNPSGLSGNPDATGSWLPKNSRVAYRVVFGKRDANGRLLLGAPSGRLVITNPDDVVVPAGSLVRASNFVTATVTNHGFFGGDIVNMTCADAGFPNLTNKSISNSGSNKPTATTFKYAETAADDTSANDATFTSGTKAVSFLFPLPSGVDTSHFYRIYRSDTTLTADADAVPSDDLYLAIEGAITSTNVSNGYVTVTDNVPDTMLLDPLYTNASDGEGIVNANKPPPVANDVVHWGGRLWFGNTTGPHRFELQLLGVGSPDGAQTNDTLHIDGSEYRASDAGGIYDFNIGAPFTSAPLQTFYAAVDLVRAVNRYSGNTSVYAYYVSGENDAPGKILLESRALGGSAFFVAASRPASWNPELTNNQIVTAVRASNVVTVTTTTAHGVTTGETVQIVRFLGTGGATPDHTEVVTSTPTSTTFTYASVGANGDVTGGSTYYLSYTQSRLERSTNDRAVNRVYYSKNQQPEAVPLLNYIDIGSRNKAIHRLVPLRDKLFVFKEDGIYVISGEAPYRVDLLDDTVRLLAPDTAVTVGNQIFALTYQGVVSVSEGGVQVVSRPIENEILRTALASGNIANTKLYSFGVSYESERSYLLWLASTSAYSTEAYVYNYLTNTWTRWPLSRSCGLVLASTDRLYTGHASSAAVFRERKAMDRSDYRDLTASTTVSAVSSAGLASGFYTLTISSMTAVFAGDLVTGSGWTARVMQDQADDEIIVYVTTGTPATGAATINYSYACDVAWAAHTGGAPGYSKHYRESDFLFKRRLFYTADGKFTSDLQQTAGTCELVFSDRSIATTGSLITRAIPVNKRVIVPRNQQRAAYLQVGFSIREAYALWELNGYGLEYDGVSERSNR